MQLSKDVGVCHSKTSILIIALFCISRTNYFESQVNIFIRRNFSLLRDKNYIGGKWVSASTGKTFNVTNPVNDRIIGSVPDSTPEDAESAIQSASDSFKKWAATPAKERGNLLQKLYQLCLTNVDELAKIITAESGKPLAEAKGEVLYSAGSTIILRNI